VPVIQQTEPGMHVLFALYEQGQLNGVRFFQEFQVLDIVIENNAVQGIITMNIKMAQFMCLNQKH